MYLEGIAILHVHVRDLFDTQLHTHAQISFRCFDAISPIKTIVIMLMRRAYVCWRVYEWQTQSPTQTAPRLRWGTFYCCQLRQYQMHGNIKEWNMNVHCSNACANFGLKFVCADIITIYTMYEYDCTRANYKAKSFYYLQIHQLLVETFTITTYTLAAVYACVGESAPPILSH